MIRLSDLVTELGGSCSTPSTNTATILADVRLDSRAVEAGDLFVALPGATTDGARFAYDAVQRGARAVLSPVPIPAHQGEALGAPVWVHPDARRVAGIAASRVHGDPARELFVVAVTGTNGKTTTAHITGQLLAHTGQRPAVLGTAGHALAGGMSVAATHTTPDAPSIHRLLAQHRESGGDSVALEASSHALSQDRLAGLTPAVAIFTNLTRDHLDYHGDFERYRDAKRRLFETLDRESTAVIHADDPASEVMADAARAQGARVVTYSAGSRADLCASQLRTDLQGTHLHVSGMGITRTRLWLPLTGRYNVENALAALAAVLVSGASPSNALDGLAAASPAPGRLERVPTGGRPFMLLVDYAHTEAALENVCSALRDGLTARRENGEPQGASGRLIVVFGCGGDRDRGKRGPMGRVVNELADVAVVTSDNPRGEDPAAIISEVCAGMQPPLAARVIEPDRELAIRIAVRDARAGDVILIAGKGHETTQTVAGEAHSFDDRLVAQEALR